MIYTGIGSRKTPAPILDIMTEVAMILATQGWCLRSGGAKGADQAFENGCDFNGGIKQIFLPIQDRPSDITNKAILLAEEVWNSRNQEIPWMALTNYTKMIMARNCLQVLGSNLETPTDLIICWTPDGEVTGGTGQALSLANMVNESSKDYVIPILNIAHEIDRAYIHAIIKGEDAVEFVNSMKKELLSEKFKPKRDSRSYLAIPSRS